MANYNNYLDIYNENKKKNKVYDDFLKLIKKIVDENTTGNYANYTCEYYIATTFGINLALLENIFYMFPKLRNNFDIYYDKNHGTNHFHSKAIGLFADRLHAVDHERNYFHPKVQIFKFADEDKYHYIVTVSSMNLTGSDNMEAYVILKGEKGEKSANQSDANQQSATPNGNKLSEYLLTVLNLEEKNEKSDEKSDENKNIEAVKIIKDIGTCVFTLYPEQNKTVKKVEFLDPGDVKETVKNMTDVTVVSPFVNAKLVEELYPNKKLSLARQSCPKKYKTKSILPIKRIVPIKRLVISCQEKDGEDTYSNKDDNNTYSNIEGFDKFKLDYYAINNLHGKIYCGLCNNADNTTDSVLIIGSSNFTSAGFGQNAEMNVKITFDGSSFNKNFMAEYFKSSSKLNIDNISQEKADSDEESFDKRSVIFDINDVTYNNNLYKFNVKTKLKVNTDKNGNIFLSEGTTADNTADNTTEFSTKHDTLRIYFKKDNEDIYLTSYLLPNLVVVNENDNNFKKHLDKLKEEGNKQFMDNHIMQLLNGESVVKPVRNPEQTTNNKDDNIRESRGTINKTYWHELLLMKSRKCSDGNGFKEWLKGIRTELEKAYNEESASADSKTSITDFIDYVKSVETIENDKKDENDMKASE